MEGTRGTREKNLSITPRSSAFFLPFFLVFAHVFSRPTNGRVLIIADTHTHTHQHSKENTYAMQGTPSYFDVTCTQLQTPKNAPRLPEALRTLLLHALIYVSAFFFFFLFFFSLRLRLIRNNMHATPSNAHCRLYVSQYTDDDSLNRKRRYVVSSFTWKDVRDKDDN